MFKILIFSILFCVCSVYGYFTLPGKCPENVQLQGEFRLADFYNKWYQAYHYSSDGQQQNNCSVIQLQTRPTGIYLNQSRVDRGLFHRYSIGKLDIPIDITDSARLQVTFNFDDAPRRLMHRKYPFYVLATNYNYYATVYTCEYSPLIDKHFIYVWILSRNELLNDVSKELAVRSLSRIGVDVNKLVKDDWSKCSPKYYEDRQAEPMTFRYPVPIH
ncbi:insecticyanin-A-like [Spodoptera frugiperda]|uniref:Insecticyanin-A-like n=1 Tax=Spodoptera frugiperda TaxID=7108 RepID=A0A9R0EPN9_SPOFR|nr:insecticyanin-A-like [Spodoptera frugiperda]